MRFRRPLRNWQSAVQSHRSKTSHMKSFTLLCTGLPVPMLCGSIILNRDEKAPFGGCTHRGFLWSHPVPEYLVLHSCLQLHTMDMVPKIPACSCTSWTWCRRYNHCFVKYVRRIIYKSDLRHQLIFQNHHFATSVHVLGQFYKWFFSCASNIFSRDFTQLYYTWVGISTSSLSKSSSMYRHQTKKMWIERLQLIFFSRVSTLLGFLHVL